MKPSGHKSFETTVGLAFSTAFCFFQCSARSMASLLLAVLVLPQRFPLLMWGEIYTGANLRSLPPFGCSPGKWYLGLDTATTCRASPTRIRCQQKSYPSQCILKTEVQHRRCKELLHCLGITRSAISGLSDKAEASLIHRFQATVILMDGVQIRQQESHSHW